jgi:NAD(P)H-binding
MIRTLPFLVVLGIASRADVACAFTSPQKRHATTTLVSARSRRQRQYPTIHLFALDDQEEEQSSSLATTRRDLVNAAFAATATYLWIPSAAFATDGEVATSDTTTTKPKVLVLGGTGFVGSQVVQLLRDQGVAVVATSRNGRNGTAALDVTTETDLAGRLQSLAAGCSAVISCIGSIGTDADDAINAATGLAATAAKAAGVHNFVYITVAPEVAEFAKDIDFLQGYMRGKKFSRDAVLKAFGDSAVFIEPTFIYGGGSFELNPPRVASFYGKFIEGLLSSSPVRSVERILSPGIIKIALEPPVPVEAIASAAVAGALGKIAPGFVLDTYDKIKQAAELM